MILFYCNGYQKNKGLSRDLLLLSCKRYCDLYGIVLDENFEIKRENGRLSFIIFDKIINISVSHSDKLWVCIIGYSEVGIDIEKERSLDYLNIAKRYFSSNEYSLVSNGGIKEFFKIWTAKEAFLKITQGKLLSFLKEELLFSKEYHVEYSNSLFEGFHLTYCLKGEDNCLNQIINLHI